MTTAAARHVDYLVIGSGFGGSVSALRLREKGYRVVVLERGKRYQAQDYPRTNWNLRKYLWCPPLGCFGIQAMTLLRHVFVLHGCGVGGGSLVYGAVLKEPQPQTWQHPIWTRLGFDEQTLRPFYDLARRMLGVTEAPVTAITDEHLQAAAQAMGCAESFHPLPVGIYFGTPGATVPDPFFEGRGPARSGCQLCGGCMVGCRFGAKNTLDQNYLYLAERLGASIVPECQVTDVRPDEDGYVVTARRSTSWFSRSHTWHARGVIFAGGVLGTVPLLLRCRERGSLPRLSARLGQIVRTNSEAITVATSSDRMFDGTHGVAIASGIETPDGTSVEMVRYGAGQSALSVLAGPLLPQTHGRPVSLCGWLWRVFQQPKLWWSLIDKRRWAERSGILLAMQASDGELQLSRERRWWGCGPRRLQSQLSSGQAPAATLPVADELAVQLARSMRGIPQGSLMSMVLKRPSTAHILGGCCLAPDETQGVVDREGRVYGYNHLYVVDGSVLPANLGVNPSLTITALAEWIMSRIPVKPTPTDQPSAESH